MRPTPLARPLLLAAAAFTAAGGYVHAEQWATTYRHVPGSVPGGWLVRVGFLVHAVTAAVLTLLLLRAQAAPSTRSSLIVTVSALAFNAGALALVVATRTGTVFGWTEPSWTLGADRSRAVACGALAVLLPVLLLRSARSRPATLASAPAQ